MPTGDPTWVIYQPGRPKTLRQNAALNRRGDAPSWLLYLSDAGRAVAECGLMLATSPLQPTLPRGDGHPVLVIPGLLTGDASTRALRRFLRRLGYSPYGWGLGRNIGPTADARDGMRQLLSKLQTQHGEQVSIIGWSLGGIFARDLARRTPDSVRQVITLGSPFRLARSSQSHASKMFDRFAHLHVEPLDIPIERTARPLPVPSTALYSRLDGIVAWQACRDVPGPQTENVEILGSHLGLTHNPAAMFVIADRLSQSPDAWHPFNPPATLRRLCRTDPQSAGAPA